MPAVSLEECLELVSAADERAFMGLRESEFLEVKGRVGWDLSSAEARYELAKDVSAFANAAGGVILVGFQTSNVPDADTDVIVAADLITEADFPSSAIQGILREYLYPAVHGLHVLWVASAQNSALGFGVIEVSAQPEELLPVLIARIAEDGSHLKQIVAGFARRVGSSSVPLSPKELQASLRDGMNPTSRRLIRIEEKIDRILSRESVSSAPATSEHPLEELLRQRLKSILEAD